MLPFDMLVAVMVMAIVEHHKLEMMIHLVALLLVVVVNKGMQLVAI